MEDDTLPARTVEQLCEEPSRETDGYRLLDLTRK